MDPIEHSAIHSRENARFKLIRSLSGSRGVKKHGLSVLAGRRLIAECLAERPESAELLVIAQSAGAQDPAQPEQPDPPGLSQLPEEISARLSTAPGLRRAAFTPELFRELDFLGAGSPLLIVRTPELPVWNSEDPASLSGLTVFLPLSDPENLGAAIRSCAAFGVDRIVLLKEAAHPFHPRALRSAAGQTWRTPLFLGPSLAQLDPMDQQIASPVLYALDLVGEDLSDAPPGGHVALLVGEEGPGIPDTLRCRRLRIPMRGEVESLNAGVALGIALYHFRRI
ncbi:MAG: RNA methyltransferase [bacterium]|nr:RNA methyltransferase [bacterium]